MKIEDRIEATLAKEILMHIYCTKQRQKTINLQVGQEQVKVAVHDTDADSKSKSHHDICGEKKVLFNDAFVSAFYDASLDDIVDRKGRQNHEPRHLDQEGEHGPEVVVFWRKFEFFRFFTFRNAGSIKWSLMPDRCQLIFGVAILLCW